MVSSIYAEVLDGQPASLLVRAYVEDDALFAQLKGQSSRHIETAYWLRPRQEVTSGTPHIALHCRLGPVAFDLAFSFEKGDGLARKQVRALVAGASAPRVLVEMVLDEDITGAHRGRIDLDALTPADTGRIAAALAGIV